MVLLSIPLLRLLAQFYSLMIQEACLGDLPFSRYSGACPQRLSKLYPAQSSVDSPHHSTIADQDGEDKAALTETKISSV